MNIVIVSPGMQHDGNTLKNKSLGGSETAAIQLAEAFARKPDAFGSKNRVVVFSPTESGQPVVVNNVSYIPVSAAESYIQGSDIDMLIVSRWQEPLMRPVNAKSVFFWCHDLALKRFEAKTRGISYQIDRFLVMSEFQKKQYIDVYSLPEQYIKKIRNGIDLAAFPAPRSKPRQLGQIVFAARPERGLENLVGHGGIMERLLAHNAPVKLLVAHYDNTVPEMKAYYEMLWNRCNQLPNVQVVGNLTKTQLYDLYSRSFAYVYPTDFEEISCISAMEAQACGLPVITTPTAALVETLHPDARIMIDGPATGTECHYNFVTAINGLYNDELRWARMSKAGYDHALDLTWEPVAEDLLAEADNIMREKSSNPSRLFKHFYEMSDIETCKMLSGTGDLELVQESVNRVNTDYEFMNSPDAYREQYDKIDGPIEGTIHGGAKISHYDGSENEPRMIVLRDFVCANASKFKTVLDYGCWIGHQTIRVANELPDAKVTGVDVNNRNIEIAEECKQKYSKYGNVEFALYDEMDKLGPIQPIGGYDLVICNEVLEHVLDPYELMERLEKACKPGGTIFITTPYGPWEYMSYKTFPYRCHIRHYEMSDLLDMFGEKEGMQLFYKGTTVDNKNRPVGHHYTIYLNNPTIPTGKVNLERKLAWQSPNQTLSVCMIAYNAEDMLHRCLKSVRDIADEIVVAIDPKTTDSTREISVQYGARIIEGIDPIKNGFEVARNNSIETALGDWILWIDSDEELLSPNNVSKYLRQNMMNGYAVQQHHLSVDPPLTLKPDLPLRIYRNRCGIKFFGVCHEHPERALNEGVGAGIVLSDTWIAHDGYLTEAIRRDRFLRNIDLVVADRKKYPERNLGKFLWLRDLIHLSRYRFEQRNGQGTDADIIKWATEAKELFESEFIKDCGNPMMPEAVTYYSEANRILNLGYPIKFMVQLKDMPPQEITAQFPNSKIAAEFIGGITKHMVSQMEGKYI
jgi:2-polyprenyl-3-methyl-5-hydroxy-6-metoxy-1,4-benzoquinol methylase/glycosyltransferase involved in cell wall biosynthesis